MREDSPCGKRPCLKKKEKRDSVIFIDADACPVRQEAIDIAIRHQVRLTLVTNGGVRPYPHDLIAMKYVASGADEADKWIVSAAGAGDIIITSDILLAAEALKRQTVVLRPDGSELTPQNIGNQLASRDLMADIRAALPLDMAKAGGGRTFSSADRGRFKQILDQKVRQMAGAMSVAQQDKDKNL